MKKGIIFDMDGTLWDSAANVAESWNLAIKQNGSVDKKLTEQDIQGVMGKTMDDYFNKAIEHFSQYGFSRIQK